MNIFLTTALNFGSYDITSDDDLADITITANGYNSFDISVSCNGHFEAETDMTWDEALVNLEWLMAADWTALRPTAKRYIVNILTALL